MRYFSKISAITAAGVIAVVAAGVWWWRARAAVPFSFRTAVVTRGDLEATISATGTIEPMEVVDVGAQVAGRIKTFGSDVDGKPIDYGSAVRQGAVLANIDDSVYAADLAVAKAQLAQAQAGELSAAANLEQMKARLVQSESEWKRSQALYDSRLLAQVDFDTARANYEVARADVSVAQAGVAEAKATTVQAQAGLEKAQRNLDFCVIRSPVNGVIIDRRVNIGQTVVASLNAPSLFLIAEDLTKMQIWVSVNEADVARIAPGAPVTFTCAAFPGRQFRGTVGKVRLNATMAQNIVIYTVVVNTENPDKVLLPYLTANVNFVVRKDPDALLVPNAALRWSPSLAEITPDARSQFQPDPPGDPAPGEPGGNRGTVWVEDGNYVRPVEVELGASDGVNTAVVAGNLRENAEVVTGASAGGGATATRNPFVPVRPHW